MMQSCIEEEVVVSSAICRQRQESDERFHLGKFVGKETRKLLQVTTISTAD
jgi:hypothetical protein